MYTTAIHQKFLSHINWAVLSDEQMRKIWPFSLLNDEQMSNKVEVKHQPATAIHENFLSHINSKSTLEFGKSHSKPDEETTGPWSKRVQKGHARWSIFQWGNSRGEVSYKYTPIN